MIDGASYLTRNFRRREFDVPEAYPAQWEAEKLIPLAERCQWLRDLVGSPGIVDSTYRSAAHNADVAGASTTSQHMDGDAADVFFPLVSIREHARAALEAIASPAFGQLIFYVVKGHVHISNPAARLGLRNGQVLVCTGADADGRDIFEPLTNPDAQLPVVTAAQKKRARSSSSSSSPSSSPALGSGATTARADGGSHAQ